MFWERYAKRVSKFDFGLGPCEIQHVSLIYETLKFFTSHCDPCSFFNGRQGKHCKKSKKSRQSKSSKGKKSKNERRKGKKGKKDSETPMQQQKRLEREEKQRCAELKKDEEKKKRAMMTQAKQAQTEILFIFMLFCSDKASRKLERLKDPYSK